MGPPSSSSAPAPAAHPAGGAGGPVGWSTPRRTHPLSPVVELAGAGRSALPLVLFLLATGRVQVVPVVIAIYVIGGWVAWFRRTWSFDGEVLTLDDGLLKRTYRRVPVSRVQQVEVHESFLHRMVGLAVLRIDTAGGAGSAEVVVQALPRSDATAVRAAVLRARDARSGDPRRESSATDVHTAGPPPPPQPENVVFRLGHARALLAGVVSSNLLIVFAFAGTALDMVARLPSDVSGDVEEQAFEAVTSLGVLLGVAVVATVGIVIAALASFASHYDLTVVRDGDELRMRRGLFDRRDAVVPLARIQSVTLRQNPVQRLLGFSVVRIRSAGSGSGDEARLLIPLVARSEAAHLLSSTLGRSLPVGDLPRAPVAARGRRIVRRVAVLAPVVVAVAFATRSATSALAAAAVAVTLAVALGLDAYRNLGHRVDGSFLVSRWGSILRRTVVVVGPRIQSLGVRRSPFQRWRDLSTLTVDLAGSGLQPVVMDHAHARCMELWTTLRDVTPESPSPPSGGFTAAAPVRDTGGVRTHPPLNEEP
ncbi:MAG: PH domain-containing protein [Acidimicrobiales bacterium]